MGNNKLTTSFIRTLVLRATPLLTIPIIIHFGGELAYGYWAQYTALVALLLPISTLNLPFSLVRFMPELGQDSDRSTLFATVASASIVTASCAAAFLYLVRDILSEALFGGEHVLVTVLILHLPLAAAYKACLDYFRSTTSVLSNTIIASSRKWLAVLGATIILVLVSSPGSLVAAWLVADALIVVATAGIIYRQLPLNLPTLNTLRQLIIFSAPLTASAIGAAGVTSLDRQLVGMIIDTRAVGVYNAGYVIGFGVQAILAPFSFLVPAVLPRHWDDGVDAEGLRIIDGSWKTFLLLVIPGIFGIWVIGSAAISLLASEAIATDAGSVPGIVAIGAACYGIYYFITRRWYLERRTTLIAVIWVVGLAVNLALNLLLIPIWDLLGAAWATVAAYATMALASGMLAGWRYVRGASLPFILKVTVIGALSILVSLQWVGSVWGSGVMLALSPVAAIGHIVVCWKAGLVDTDVISLFKTL